ncbi:H+/oligopeptide symporter [Colletotrichum abscissum]|uniref:H+/oligopeptide symporter n=1 Tax=Colletotrichum abscissum TaxID=1671311 RepID=A0A9P9XSP4_9PEZI|nr:H+/oligopeptide symporter [Colletotrichum abscissum]KAI3558913.1 H+/oligopeptide symporter [Colletotrichum abscissum]KAK1513903.1 H+/oligopeptide symporter [Colletotrichum abscissum]
MYGSLGIVGFVSGCALYFCFYPGRDRKMMDQGVITDGTEPGVNRVETPLQDGP